MGDERGGLAGNLNLGNTSATPETRNGEPRLQFPVSDFSMHLHHPQPCSCQMRATSSSSSSFSWPSLPPPGAACGGVSLPPGGYLLCLALLPHDAAVTSQGKADGRVRGVPSGGGGGIRTHKGLAAFKCGGDEFTQVPRVRDSASQ